jgi:hypothetical protein
MCYRIRFSLHFTAREVPSHLKNETKSNKTLFGEQITSKLIRTQNMELSFRCWFQSASPNQHCYYCNVF